jgi:hypothetical protein
MATGGEVMKLNCQPVYVNFENQLPGGSIPVAIQGDYGALDVVFLEPSTSGSEEEDTWQFRDWEEGFTEVLPDDKEILYLGRCEHKIDYGDGRVMFKHVVCWKEG